LAIIKADILVLISYKYCTAVWCNGSALVFSDIFDLH